VLALYAVTAGLSGALVALFAHQLCKSEGYVPDFQASVLVVAIVAGAYIALQFLYMGVVRLLKPTRSSAHFGPECLSHVAAILLFPQILRWDLPWPHPVLAKAQPLILLALFVAVHLFFKFLSFFGALRGIPASRSTAVAWLATAAGAVFLTYSAVLLYARDLDERRPVLTDSQQPYRLNDAYVLAQPFPEGTLIDMELDEFKGQRLLLRFANMPDQEHNDPLDSIHVTVLLYGDEESRFRKSISLGDTWNDIVVPADTIPENVTHCRITWAYKKAPVWRRLTGFQPVVLSDRRVLLSGPWVHQERELADTPNILVIALDALGAQRVSSMRYKRETTPQLDRLVSRSLAFPNAYTPTPDATGAYMTLMTGLNPLRHRYFMNARGPLPSGVRTTAEILRGKHYATAAFTEGERAGAADLTYDSGFERGFDAFDASYLDDAPLAHLGGGEAQSDRAGSRVTVDKALAWLEQNRASKFFLFVRLRELADLRKRPRYDQTFLKNPGAPAQGDVYDSALVYLDGLVGELIQATRVGELRRNTLIVVASPYGYDFGAADETERQAGITEDSLRVPLVLYLPGAKKVPRPEIVNLSDVAPTLLNVAGIDPEPAMEGDNILIEAGRGEATSMTGDPLVLSYRTKDWRATWATGLRPGGVLPEYDKSQVRLYSVRRSQQRGWTYNSGPRNPQTTQRHVEGMRLYLESNLGGLVQAETVRASQGGSAG
jgi:arylsulfatase A-like enzyme